MIADMMDNLDSYRGLSPTLDETINWLQSAELGDLKLGEHVIRADALRVIVQEYQTVAEAGRQFEAHRRYIDVQCVVSGTERMLVHPIDGFEAAGEYDAGNDVVFFETPSGRPLVELIVPPGGFAVFFPHDGHMPMIQAQKSEAVRKVVVKVLVED